MPDIANAKYLFNCCIKTALDFSKKLHPGKPKDGAVIRCIFCEGGWMMYDLNKDQWAWTGPLGDIRLTALNEKDWQPRPTGVGHTPSSSAVSQ